MKTVLLIGDDEAHISSLHVMAWELGLELIVAKTAIDARQALSERGFTLLISEAWLPDEDSTDFINSMRIVYPEVYCCLISEDETPKQHPAHRFLQKPLGKQALVELLHEAVSHARC